MQALAARLPEPVTTRDRPRPPVQLVQRSPRADADLVDGLEGRCACGGACADCAGAEPAPAIVREAVEREGRPLHPADRAAFEPSFGDLTSVRIHTGVAAAESARRIDAAAFTVGEHVVFDTGRYAPGSPEGRRLLAHELTHVVQQRGAAAPANGVLRISHDSTLEREAQRGAEGAPATTGAPVVAVARQDAAATAADVQSTVDAVEQALSRPNPIAGVGDQGEAFRILAALEDERLMAALAVLAQHAQLANLIAYEQAAPPDHRARLLAAIRASHLIHTPADLLTESDFLQTATALDALPADHRESLLRRMAAIRVGTADLATLMEGVSALMAMATAVQVNPQLAGVGGAVAPGPWQPPGGQPIPFYLGTQAHIGIAASYVAAHPGDPVAVNFTPISTILERLALLGVTPNAAAVSAADLALRPDIMNLSPARRHLYEIKPQGSQALGRTEARLYQGILTAAGVPVALGPVGEPGTMGAVPAPAGVYIFEAVEAGVIVYQYRRAHIVPVPVPEGERRRFRLPRFELQPLTQQQQVAMAGTAAMGTMLIIMMIVLSPAGI